MIGVSTRASLRAWQKARHLPAVVNFAVLAVAAEGPATGSGRAGVG